MKTRVRWWMLLPTLFLCGTGCSEQNQAIPPTPPDPSSKTITLAFTGDVMLGRGVNQRIGELGYAYPWGDLLPDLRAADILFCNLETTLTRHTNAVPKVFNFRADPDRARSLVAAGVDICSLANNHILDFGIEGMRETLDVLQSNDIAGVGAGSNLAAASTCVVLERDGLRIGFIAGTDNEPTWAADAETPGTHFVTVTDSAAVEQIAHNAAQQVDVLVYSTHWGPNYRQAPPRSFQRFARRMIDAGVDIVHGHSAHIFQGIEVYKDGVILYDTGDFVDDYRVDADLRNDRSFLYRVTLSASKVQALELIPTRIDQCQVNRAPRVDARASRSRLQKLCKPFGTQLVEKGDRLWVRIAADP